MWRQGQTCIKTFKRKTPRNIERQRYNKIEYVKDNGKIFLGGGRAIPEDKEEE